MELFSIGVDLSERDPTRELFSKDNMTKLRK